MECNNTKIYIYLVTSVSPVTTELTEDLEIKSVL